MRICLIACSASKAPVACAARRLYTGDLFTKSLRWAEAGGFDSIHVLSAKHGLVDIDQVVEPYDTALQQFSAPQRREWAARVVHQVLQVIRPHGESEICALAGRHYTDELAMHVQLRAPAARFHRPLAGLGIGEQKAWLKRALVGMAGDASKQH